MLFYNVHPSLARCLVHIFIEERSRAKEIKAIKSASVFNGFDLKRLCFIMIANDYDKTEVTNRGLLFPSGIALSFRG